jgi:hypothetical protein
VELISPAWILARGQQGGITDGENQMEKIFKILMLAILAGGFSFSCNASDEQADGTDNSGGSDSDGDSDGDGDSAADFGSYSFTGVWLFSGVKEVCSQTLPDGELKITTIQVSVYDHAEGATEYDDNDNTGADGDADADVDADADTDADTDADAESNYTLLKTVSVNCEEGSFVVGDLKRGAYFVKVEALVEYPWFSITGEADAGESTDLEVSDPQIQAFYVGSDTVVMPTSSDEPVKFDMRINRGSIEVTWGFNQGDCSSEENNVEKVSVALISSSSINNVDSGKLDCDIEGQAYLFKDLSWDTYTVTITGFDKNGTETFFGSLDRPIEIFPGTEISGPDGYIELVPVE